MFGLCYCFVFVINGVTTLLAVSVLASLKVVGANIGRQPLLIAIRRSKKYGRSDTFLVMIRYSAVSRLIECRQCRQLVSSCSEDTKRMERCLSLVYLSWRISKKQITMLVFLRNKKYLNFETRTFYSVDVFWFWIHHNFFQVLSL